MALLIINGMSFLGIDMDRNYSKRALLRHRVRKSRKSSSHQVFGGRL